MILLAPLQHACTSRSRRSPPLVGVIFAWWPRRRKTVSIRNAYLATIVAVALDAFAVKTHSQVAQPVTIPLTGTVAASVVGGGGASQTSAPVRSSAPTNSSAAGCGSPQSRGPTVRR